MSKIVAPLILLVIVAVFSTAFITSRKPNNQPEKNNFKNQEIQRTSQNQIIYYFGQGCPHCANVKEFIEKNKVHEKLSFEEKEVWYNRSNAAELEEKAKRCGISDKDLGVPFLWDGKKCFVGDVDVINFFKSKISSS